MVNEPVPVIDADLRDRIASITASEDPGPGKLKIQSLVNRAQLDDEPFLELLRGNPYVTEGEAQQVEGLLFDVAGSGGNPATTTGDVPDNFEGPLPGPDRQPTNEMPVPTTPEPGDDGRNVDLADSAMVVIVVGAIIWVLSRVFR